MNYAEKIVELCRLKRISTTEVADAMGKTGVIPHIPPINSGQYSVGPVRCVFTANNSNFYVHDQIRDVQPGEVVVVFTENCENRAILGDIVAKYILVKRQAAAIVVQGAVRDVTDIISRKYPVWSMGITPIGCFNKETTPFDPDKEQELRQRYEGGIAICDDCGVVVVPKRFHTAEMLEKLHRIRIQEELWEYCIFEKGWDTKKTICEKAYLEDHESKDLPKEFVENLEALSKPFDGPKI